MVTTTTKTFSNSSTLQLRYLPHRSSRLKSRGGRKHSDMSDRKIRWAPRLEPGDHISGCDYLGLRELDSSSVDTLLQLSVRWSSPCTGHHQSCPVQPALATPAKLLGALRTGNTHEVVLCLAHWQRLRSADVASNRLRSLLTSTVV